MNNGDFIFGGKASTSKNVLREQMSTGGRLEIDSCDVAFLAWCKGELCGDSGQLNTWSGF